MSKASLNLPVLLSRATHRRIRTLSIRAALWKHGLAKAHTIPSFTAREELEALYTLAQNCPPDARVLEVGSYVGASTCYLAAGLRGAHPSITCLDTWNNETMPDGTRDTLAEFERNVRPVRQNLTLIQKASSDVSKEDLGSAFNLVFLDGDHSYRQTRADFELVEDRVALEGILAFHDSLFFEGVSRVIGEALASGKWQIGGTVRNLFWILPAKFSHSS